MLPVTRARLRKRWPGLRAAAIRDVARAPTSGGGVEPAGNGIELCRDHLSFDAPADHIAETMTQHRISAVPVVDETGTLLGLVSEYDLLAKPGGFRVVDEHGGITGGRTAIADADQ